ncbi:hypothetical protein FNF29_02905 [Cafeteria roenbergensis]|uniref:VWFA domain-containing protein n=1 Tax=Cafeteria roenbergensis TaxID=33653 RepID=A0A5A8CN23_CAFRO|nr:hypothetical protein FNF29_02905 [Cafeteria roenbergensis]|eukprot:KAA0153917.1 hypothetical protein FNF29_02905 [Cafeteria roenbergensis]
MAATEWASAERAVAKCAEELCTVLEECVMPHNRHTRRRPDVKGQFSPQRVVIACMTEWRHRKIYTSKTAGGKRNYAFCLALDASLSMDGVLQCCAVESLVAVVSALGMMGLDSFSVIVFGSRVTLVKSEDQPWDAATVHGLLAALSHRIEDPSAMRGATAAAATAAAPRGESGALGNVYGTADADAVEYGLNLLRESGSSGPKKLWVFTDGYTSCGQRLTEALVDADKEGVEVLGIAVGPDRSFTSTVYQHWVRAAMPTALSPALRALFSREAVRAPMAAQSASLQDSTPLWARMRVRDTCPSDSSIQGILGSMQQAFPDLAAKMDSIRKLKLVRGNAGGVMQVDVAFVLDVTGSMRPWLGAVKEQLRAIMQDIGPKFAEKWPQVPILLRFAVLPYRDIGEETPDPHDFEPIPVLPADDVDGAQAAMDRFCAEAHSRLQAYVKTLSASGGGDEPEDLLGALTTSANTLSWEGRVRLAIVLTDAPCHGSNFHAEDIADSLPDPDAAKSAAKTALRALDKHGIDTMLCHVKRDATRQMEEQLRSIYASLRRPDGSLIDPSRRLLKSLDLFKPGDGGEVRQSMHLVFVLDESYSMNGAPWEALMQAYRAFLDIRKDANQGIGMDRVSVVLFDDTARTVAAALPIEEVPGHFARTGSGTAFSPALRDAEIALRSTPPGYSPLVLFMSDGHGSGGEAEMARIHETYAGKGLQVHSIAFGGAKHEKLRLLAEHAHGAFHAAPDPTSLRMTFTRIAAAAGAADGLVSQFAKYVAENVADKLVSEYM